MRPGAPPPHALRRTLHQRPREARHVRVFGRSGLRRLVRRRKLYPAAARVEEVEERAERGMVGADRLEKFSGMVDHEPAREALDLRFVRGEFAAIELDIGVPAER